MRETYSSCNSSTIRSACDFPVDDAGDDEAGVEEKERMAALPIFMLVLDLKVGRGCFERVRD
jgi:hypothetical protein